MAVTCLAQGEQFPHFSQSVYLYMDFVIHSWIQFSCFHLQSIMHFLEPLNQNTLVGGPVGGLDGGGQHGGVGPSGVGGELWPNQEDIQESSFYLLFVSCVHKDKAYFSSRVSNVTGFSGSTLVRVEKSQ